MTSFLSELSWRGLIHQTAGDDTAGHLSVPRVAYAGFDPTADSLTIGNMLPLLMLARWQRCGHAPIALMGGGTGLIGDPSGKSAERTLQTAEQVEANIDGQRPVFERILDFSPSLSNRATLLNNADWLTRIGYVEMLRDIGKHFSVNQMIQRDSVATRLHAREQGISYTEFSYVLLQAYDALHLHRTRRCTVQLGGSDQFGNIVSGMDLIRRLENASTHGIVAPLLTDRAGNKIGKSEKGAIYTAAHRTSPWDFHQYWLNAADDEVIRYLRWFTFLSREEIDSIDAAHTATPHERSAQKRLAAIMTELVHGVTELARVEAASAALFGSRGGAGGAAGDPRALDEASLREVFAEVPHTDHPKSALEGDGAVLLDILAASSLVQSRREAKEFLGNGAISVNGEKADADRRLTTSDLLHGHTILLRRGKKQWHATRWA